MASRMKNGDHERQICEGLDKLGVRTLVGHMSGLLEAVEAGEKIERTFCGHPESDVVQRWIERLLLLVRWFSNDTALGWLVSTLGSQILTSRDL